MADQATNLFDSITTSSIPGPLPCASIKAKGCGYHGQSNGLHTIQYTTQNHFVGNVVIQGTLATDPTDSDWYEIRDVGLGDGVTPVADGTVLVSFPGNHVWIRAVIVSFAAGDLNRVLFTHN